ncbi:molybdenum cofactor guanylyltransferase [Aquihabitans daechungensis]|uniref:molybdenum cofactor guanylyltransferase n=1 Tax=Aquihabitans daechungensis TaxID=1052257 RepID=UPI003B9F0BA0
MSDAVMGAVLVGGASRRMGQDKGALALEGTPMAHRVRRVLFDAGVGSVVFVGGPASDEGAIPDRWPGEGPLAGLATAVLHGAAVDGVEIVVVAACDQPDLTTEVLASLVQALHASPHEVVGSVARTSDGRRHPFPSAWRCAAGERLRSLVEAGQRRADAALEAGPVVEVPAPEAALEDLDTPADVAAWVATRGGASRRPLSCPSRASRPTARTMPPWTFQRSTSPKPPDGTLREPPSSTCASPMSTPRATFPAPR